MKALDAIPDHRRRLELIFDASSQPPRARSLYASLAASSDEPAVQAVLARVGAARIDYLDACYRKLGLPPVEARARAVFAFAAYRGLLQLAHEFPRIVRPIPVFVAISTAWAGTDTARSTSPNSVFGRFWHARWQERDGAPQNTILGFTTTREGGLWPRAARMPSPSRLRSPMRLRSTT